MEKKINEVQHQNDEFQFRPEKTSNIGNASINKSSHIYHQKQYLDYNSKNQNLPKNEKIIHHSIKRNIDQEGNTIITTKIVREVDVNAGDNILNSNSIADMIPNTNIDSLYKNNGNRNDILYYSSNEAQEKLRHEGKNENFIFSPSSYGNKYNNFNSYNTNVCESEASKNYYSQYDGSRIMGDHNLTNDISPILPNYTSESDFEGTKIRAQRKTNYLKYNQNPNSEARTIGMNRISYNKFHPSISIEDNSFIPESDYNYRYNNYSYYRNSPISKIKGAQPIYQKFKEKHNFKNNLIDVSDDYDSSMNIDIKKNRTQINKHPVKKIINEVYRNNIDSRGPYDIINENAIIIQSHIRGFLTRKKVLRYITLAINYQSFCDKLTDILIFHVKEEIFNLLKNKLKVDTKYRKLGKNRSVLNMNRKNNNIGNVLNTINDQYSKIIKNNYYTTLKNDSNIGSSINYEDYNPKRLITDNYYHKHHLNRSTHYNKTNKYDYSVSPNSKIIHYFEKSPCSLDKPSYRYYKEISGKAIRSHYYNTSKDVKNLKNINSNFKTYNLSGIKRTMHQEKSYVNEVSDGQYEYSRIIKERIYRLPNENNTLIMFQEKPEFTSGIGSRSTTRLVKKKNIKLNEDIHKFNQNEIESDNYISINIVKSPQKKERATDENAKKVIEDVGQIRSKSVSTQDKGINTTQAQNKISKRENISIIIRKQGGKKKVKYVKKVKEDKKDLNKNKVRELLIKITYRKILGEKMKLNNAMLKWFKIANKLKKLDNEKKLRAEQDKKEKERKERERKDKENRDKQEREDREKREKEEQILIERERIIKIEKEKIERERKEMERKNKEDQLRRDREEKDRKEKEEKERLERERQLKLEQEKRERERKEKERKEKLEREKRERERKEKEEQQRLERERKIQEQKELMEKQKRERERKEREEKLKKEREDKLKKQKEEQLRLEREKKLKEEQEKRERERKERERKQKEEQDRIAREKLKKEREEAERLRIIEKQRLERIEIYEREKREREKKQKEEQDRLARERKMKEEKERREKERIEKERREREEKLRIERERERKMKEEQERREREKKSKSAYQTDYQSTTKTTKTTTIKKTFRREIADKEKNNSGSYQNKYFLTENKPETKYGKVITTEKYMRKDKPQKYFNKTIEIEEASISKLNTFETQKTKRSKNDSFQYISPKKKIQESSSMKNITKSNIATIKYKDEGVNVKFPPSFNPADLKNRKENSESFKKKQKMQKEVILKTKKIENINFYGVKKDCQKRLNELKMQMEEEFAKRMQMEKKRELEEQKKSQEKMELKNKKEIEKLIEMQKQKEIERQKEFEREKELQKKRDMEREKEKEKEIKMGIQIEVEKQKKILEERDLEEKNRKRKAMKVNKEIEFNIEKDLESKGKIVLRKKEEDIERAKEIIRIFILSRGDPFLKMRKYFNIWRRKVKYLKLLEYSKIIQDYCRGNIEFSKLKKAIKIWKYLAKKIFYKTRIKILRMKKKVDMRKKKLYQLIRITRLNVLFSKRRFIHYIILIWFIYARNVHKKRINMKLLYENLLKTYMNVADDIFGNNQTSNPSVQDALYEAVNTEKFITLIPSDVPLAKIHYQEMKNIKLGNGGEREDFKNATKILQKSSTTTKLEIGKKELKKIYLNGRNNENSTENDNEEIQETQGVLDSKSGTYRTGGSRGQRNSYESNSKSGDKNSSNIDKKYERKLKDIYTVHEKNEDNKDENNKLNYKNKFGKNYAKTEENFTNKKKDEKVNDTWEKYKNKNNFGYKVEKKDDKEKYKFGNKINIQGNVKMEIKDSKTNENNKYDGKFKGYIGTKTNDNKTNQTDNNIKTAGWNKYNKTNDNKDDKKNFTKIETKTEIKSKYQTENNTPKKSKYTFGTRDNTSENKNNKTNYESKYKTNKNETNIRSEQAGNKYENKFERKTEIKANNDNNNNRQDSTKVYKSRRFKE